MPGSVSDTLNISKIVMMNTITSMAIDGHTDTDKFAELLSIRDQNGITATAIATMNRIGCLPVIHVPRKIMKFPEEGQICQRNSASFRSRLASEPL